MPITRHDREGREFTGRFDLFDCKDWCGVGVAPASEVREKQASRLCTLASFRGEWTQPRYQDMARLTSWQGRLPIVTDEGRDERPGEDVARDGCPGGWARCGFAMSFLPYRRTRLADGSHDSNPRVGHHTDPFILDALAYFEKHQAQAEAEFQRLR